MNKKFSICLSMFLALLIFFLTYVLQIENYNEPFLHSLSEYDDGQDLSNYDFNNDGFCFPYDDSNKKKLAYRHRLIAQKYSQVLKIVFIFQSVSYKNVKMIITSAIPLCMSTFITSFWEKKDKDKSCSTSKCSYSTY